jgi:Na+-transporting NADH:ubiquinone oxidoreductase subunit C
MQRDSLANTFTVAIVLCIICSLVVSASAVGLRSIQDANKAVDQRRNIIAAAGLSPGKKPTAAEIDTLFKRIEKKIVDLETGDYVEGDLDPNTYDPRKAAKEPSTSIEIKSSFDPGVPRREKYSVIFVIHPEEGSKDIEQYIFPVYGKGLWSTLYGFVALKSDLNTVEGLTFYEHAETPGLGGEVDATWWKDQWKGKKIYNDAGVGSTAGVRVSVAKGKPLAENLPYEVDGLSGATITSRGVGTLLKYWFSDDGFGKYVKKQLSKKGAS